MTSSTAPDRIAVLDLVRGVAVLGILTINIGSFAGGSSAVLSPALLSPDQVQKGLAYTRDFVSTLYRSAQEAVAQGMDLAACMKHVRRAMDPKFAQVFIYEHCLPFDVTRAHDEASGIRDPRIWTAERDQQMWHALQAA